MNQTDTQLFASKQEVEVYTALLTRSENSEDPQSDTLVYPGQITQGIISRYTKIGFHNILPLGFFTPEGDQEADNESND